MRTCRPSNLRRCRARCLLRIRRNPALLHRACRTRPMVVACKPASAACGRACRRRADCRPQGQSGQGRYALGARAALQRQRRRDQERQQSDRYASPSAGQELIIPGPGWTAEAPAAPSTTAAEVTAQGETYKVQTGDTPRGIANKFEITERADRGEQAHPRRPASDQSDFDHSEREAGRA